VEALLRWQDPEQGMIAPGYFIPLAEETGLIVPIAEWVLYTACAQAKTWLDEGAVPVYVAVNLSPVQFRGQDIVSLVRSVLDKTGLPAQYLELEITEGILMEQADQALITLFNLKTLGVSLAVDDFGTGYSSLAYLKQFPLDKLKIDRSFVDGLGCDANDQAIVKAIIAMGQSLGIKTLAEGVESRQQFEILQQLGCQFYQGYFFSKPCSADQLKV
jgi:EAL domain-containing protein (putative c-di-GMP-specific phosphodiesterase class I)